MQVVFISGSYPPIRCGIGDYTRRLATALAEQGTIVKVITSSEGVVADSDGRISVVPIVPSWNFAALGKILAHLRLERPNVVNVQYPTQRYGRDPFINVLPAFIRIHLRLPVITTIHEFSTYRLLGKLRVGLSVLTSQRVIVTDLVNLQQIARAFPVAQSKLQYVPVGANIEPVPQDFDRRQLRMQCGARDSDVVVAYFGFISPSKGIEVLLRAFDLACRQRPELRLLLIADREIADARYADYHRHIEQMLDRMNCKDRIFWTGYATPEQVSRYLASADFAVLPFSDGASLRRTTLLSALKHGLPVLSTGTQSPCAGVQVTPIGDVNALMQTIVHLSSDQQLLAQMSGAAKQAAANIDWQVIAQRVTAVFEKL